MSRCVNFEQSSRPLLQVRLHCHGQVHTICALIDSGADANLLDVTLAAQLGIERESLEKPIHATALDGHLLGRVTHRSVPLSMALSGNHTEVLTFHLIRSPQQPLILGLPWLKRHNPHIDWSTGSILQWSSLCHASCLRSASSPVSNPLIPTEFSDLSNVP